MASFKIFIRGILFPVLFFSCTQSTNQAGSPLIVHEWGTLTTAHSSDGTPQGGMNVVPEDESLPSFVHVLSTSLTGGGGKSSNAGDAHPEVTMRLETPVIYFYPEKSMDSLTVSASFKGGILNEFYPTAEPLLKGIDSTTNGPIFTPKTQGTLTWKNISLEKAGEPACQEPPTEALVWLAPRQPASAKVKTTTGECEKYIFYRGLAHLNAPFSTTHDTSRIRLSGRGTDPMPIPALWVVQIQEGGSLAFRKEGPVDLGKNPEIPLGFTSFSQANLKALRQSMEEELLKAGLYPLEAKAMMDTWEGVYFGKTGIRIFYITPRAWVDAHLPLTFSTPVDVTRAFIGRIDLL